ncbi:MAG: hypothetical protein OQJ93_06120 [Ignavibacteriaceae bacterium]|nr:hypothetical protein [Ignavibacteriaceae bacterium]
MNATKENQIENTINMKRIAIAVFQERVASRLEFAKHLLLVKVDNEKIKFRELVLLREEDPLKKIDIIFELKPDILICGGLTKMCEYKLRRSNIILMPWIWGNAENILSLCLKNTVIDGGYYTTRMFEDTLPHNFKY